jgi:D-beta-D-heptose 7-phosphate kinase/D-beta-D-heptose 1-phosphate adenosyltransferase
VTKGSGGADYQGVNYPGIGVGVFDVCGAGDTFLSALVYFYLLYAKIEKAIPYANKAAAIAVTHFGTYVLSERDVNEICD